MNQQVKERLLFALRSGDYQQGRGQLRRDLGGLEHDEFCCLGVLFDVVHEDLDLEWIPPNTDSGYDLYACPIYDDDDIDDVTDTSEGELSQPVLDHCGLTYDEQSELMIMNDGSRPGGNDCETEIFEGDQFIKGKAPKSFLEIADYIEENF